MRLVFTKKANNSGYHDEIELHERCDKFKIREEAYPKYFLSFGCKKAMALIGAEHCVVTGIKRGVKQKKFYKDIYQDVKGDVEIFAESHGQLEIIDSQLKIEA